MDVKRDESFKPGAATGGEEEEEEKERRIYYNRLSISRNIR